MLLVGVLLSKDGLTKMKLYTLRETWLAALLGFLALRGFTWTMALLIICIVAFLIGVHK